MKSNFFTFIIIFTMLISVRGGTRIIKRLFSALILPERCHTYFHNKNAASSTTMADSGLNGENVGHNEISQACHWTST